MPGLNYYPVFEAETIAAGGVAWSQPIPLWPNFSAHTLSLQATLDGTVKIEMYIRDDIETKDNTPFSGFTRTSGPEANGKQRKSLAFRGGGTARFKATETSGNNSVTISSYLWQGGGVRT